MSQYSDAPNGQSSRTDPYEPAYHPGTQTEEQAADPLNTDLFAPDHSQDPYAFSAWKKAQSTAPEPPPDPPARRG